MNQNSGQMRNSITQMGKSVCKIVEGSRALRKDNDSLRAQVALLQSMSLEKDLCGLLLSEISRLRKIYGDINPEDQPRWKDLNLMIRCAQGRIEKDPNDQEAQDDLKRNKRDLMVFMTSFQSLLPPKVEQAVRQWDETMLAEDGISSLLEFILTGIRPLLTREVKQVVCETMIHLTNESAKKGVAKKKVAAKKPATKKKVANNKSTVKKKAGAKKSAKKASAKKKSVAAKKPATKKKVANNKSTVQKKAGAKKSAKKKAGGRKASKRSR